IGTAKLSASQHRGVPHHLIDIADPREPFTAGDYARLARPLLSWIGGRGLIPIVVGGTGFYLSALLEGLFSGPARDDALRTQLLVRHARRPRFLHRLLRRLDPAAAARIHANDTNKLVRAIEVCMVEGQPMSRLFVERQSEALAGFTALKLVLSPDRGALYRSLNQRCEAMLSAGLVGEAKHLLASGCPPSAKPFESLGYAQVLRLLRGELNQDQALEEMRRETRRYAKRQITWFRRERGMHWLAGFGGDAEVREAALAMAQAWLDATRASSL
ncbi:MAG: tRNA (adenosine(37)-N6)-dimethylallyltransferase MiaA, partial [Bryobacteraceae bacterium]